jgi:hypothetical protein
MVKRMVKPKKLKTPLANVSEGGSLKLDDLTRMNLLRLQAEQRDALSSLRLESLTLNAYLQKIDPQGTIRLLQTKLAQLQNRAEQLKVEYNTALVEIGNRLKIDMKNYSFDDVSGLLNEIPAPPKQES